MYALCRTDFSTTFDIFFRCVPHLRLQNELRFLKGKHIISFLSFFHQCLSRTCEGVKNTLPILLKGSMDNWPKRAKKRPPAKKKF